MSERTSQWESLPPMSAPRNGCVAVYMNGKVFVAGGKNRTGNLDLIEYYNIDHRRWTEILSNMSARRCAFAGAVVGNSIYMAGGYDGSVLKTVDVYKVESGTWATSPPMSTNRYGCAGVAVGDEFFVFGGRDRLLMIGGIDRSEEGPLNTGEVFNVKTREWKDLPPMSSPRFGCAAAAFGRRIYVVGGYDGTSILDTVEVFDIEARTWSVLPHRMSTKRTGCAAVAVGNNIVVMGGRDESNAPLNTVDMYDINVETWTDLPAMASKRFACAAVALGGSVYVMGGRDGNSYLDSVEQINFSDGFVKDMLLSWRGGRWSSEVAPILHWRASIVHEMEIHPSLMPTLLSRIGLEERLQTVFEIIKETMSLFEYTWTPK